MYNKFNNKNDALWAKIFTKFNWKWKYKPNIDNYNPTFMIIINKITILIYILDDDNIWKNYNNYYINNKYISIMLGSTIKILNDYIINIGKIFYNNRDNIIIDDIIVKNNYDKYILNFGKKYYKDDIIIDETIENLNKLSI